MTQINDEGLALIKRWEGFRPRAYLCPAGKWTIGYGHTKTAKEGMVVTEQEAEQLLRLDLQDAESCISSAVKVPLTDNQFAALVSWAFNVGCGAVQASTLVRKLNAGDYAAVPRELLRWNKVKGKVNNGLVNRRAAEIGLWSRGSFVTGREVEPAVPATSSPGLDAAKLGSVAAAAAGLAPLVSSFEGMSWPVALILVGGVVAGTALLMTRWK